MVSILSWRRAGVQKSVSTDLRHPDLVAGSEILSKKFRNRQTRTTGPVLHAETPCDFQYLLSAGLAAGAGAGAVPAGAGAAAGAGVGGGWFWRLAIVESELLIILSISPRSVLGLGLVAGVAILVEELAEEVRPWRSRSCDRAAP